MKKTAKRIMTMLLVAVMLFGIAMPGITSGSLAPFSIEASAASVTSSESGKWIAFIPANVTVQGYETATSTAKFRKFSPQSESYTVRFTGKYYLSDGSVRYLYIEDGISIYFVLPSSASVYQLPGTPSSVKHDIYRCRDRKAYVTFSSVSYADEYYVRISTPDYGGVTKGTWAYPSNGTVTAYFDLGTDCPPDNSIHFSWTIEVISYRIINSYSYKGSESTYGKGEINDNTCGMKGYTHGIYGINYIANGGTGGPTTQNWPNTCSGSTTLSYSEPTREGYNFLGWSENSNATSPTYYPGSTVYFDHNQLFLYAVWEPEAVDTYTVYYDANGGYGAPPSQTYTGDYVTLSTTIPYRTGYTFVTWTDTPTPGIVYVSYPPGEKATYLGSTTLYAVWRANEYTVNYNANGGSGAPSSQTKYHGSSLTLSSTVPTRNYTITYNANGGSVSPSSKAVNCKFLNWNTAQNGSGTSYKSGATYSANSNVTLYAQYATPTAGSLATPTRSGYTFDGWYTAASGGTKVTASTVISKNTTIYAHWTKNVEVYTVTWIVDGAKTTHSYEVGAKITPPANPTKSGYTFKGWTPSVPSTMPAKNLIFTAVFEKNAEKNKFLSSERFWFGNSSAYFVTSWSNNSYYMTDADMNKLINYVKKYEYDSAATISRIQTLKNSEWGGSCYGMAAAVLLDKSNAIAFNENFGNGAKSMYEVASPNNNEAVMSAINYYMLSQKINFIDSSSYYYNSYNSNWSQGLKKLVETAKAGNPFLFCYFFDRGGHAIVAYDYKLTADGTHNIITYDNRYPNKDLTIAIDKNFKTATLSTPNGNENMLAVEFYPDMKAFDKIDIDGPANDMKITYSDYSYSSSNHTIEILAEGNVTVTNEEGKTLTYSNGVVGGNMNIVSTHMIVNSTEDGNPAAPTLVFEVSPSDSFTFESTSDEMSASVLSDSMYASADSKNADCIVIGNDEGVYVMGENMEYNATLSSKNDGYDTINIDGNAEKDVSLTYNNKDVVASGVNGSNGNVSVYSNIVDVDSYKYQSGYNDIKITAEGKNDGNIDILGSNDNGNTFGTSIKIDEATSSDVSFFEALLNFFMSIFELIFLPFTLIFG